MWTSLFNSLRNAFVTATLVLCCFLPREAIAVAIYDWTPNPGSGGTGFFSLDPLGVGATDSDFTSAIVIDFNFVFDNGAPAITLADIVAREVPMAVGGVLVAITHFENPAVFTDATLVFAAGSADYKGFLDPNSPAPPFPLENNAGSWFLRGTPEPPAVIPEPSTLLLLASGLAGLGFFRRRRKREISS